MRASVIRLFARKLWTHAFHSKGIYGILIVMFLMVGYAAYSGWKTYVVQNDIREHYQHIARESWENNPDKHPHRMAHYGSFAFRMKHPLSVFDFGLESFTGNAVYLEAHKQNTINFSEASLSTGLLRFGEISMAMLLQLILPLVIIFLGFSAIAADRENGTLRILLTQGARWNEIIVGNSAGLMMIACVVAVPVLVITGILVILGSNSLSADIVFRYSGIVIGYLIFLSVICIITILVSAKSATSTSALMKLLGLWLLLAILLPRTMQALGSYFYDAPSKVEFETAIEEDVLKEGDSHNPDDPHYKHLKDSVLQVHQVDSVEKLPFNYSGFVMREGERISATIYNNHLKKLTATYDKQNSFTRAAAFFNPFTAIRNVSMCLSSTDFESYKVFQDEAEAYRYQLAQKMNELQMEFISNKRPGPTDAPHTISQEHWKEFPDFKARHIDVGSSLRHELGSILALLFWSAFSVILIIRVSKNAKAF